METEASTVTRKMAKTLLRKLMGALPYYAAAQSSRATHRHSARLEHSRLYRARHPRGAIRPSVRASSCAQARRCQRIRGGAPAEARGDLRGCGAPRCSAVQGRRGVERFRAAAPNEAESP